ncbi:MAG: site-specific DNA-methyltransferase [Chloroflexi bacterium]|nr:site-specific DNA-methyltransferase [Chloroflexota bacterium]
MNPSPAPDERPLHPGERFIEHAPLYSTALGSAFVADSLALLDELPSASVQAVVTSPPYALHFQKEYGNQSKDDYVAWFLPFAEQIRRVLKPDGSFFLNIGGSYNSGTPTRSLYHFRLLIALCDRLKFHLAQELFWYNPAKLPAPAEWVNVRRIRVKDSVEYFWWLSPSAWPKANNRKVLVPYSVDMRRILERGYRPKLRPSGHNITDKFQKDNGGATPSNLIERGNNESNSAYIQECRRLGLKVHPARFPAAVPEFAIKLTTDIGDLVLDPFAGSNMTGWVAETHGRQWLSIEKERAYLAASAVRFPAHGSGLVPVE